MTSLTSTLDNTSFLPSHTSANPEERWCRFRYVMANPVARKAIQDFINSAEVCDWALPPSNGRGCYSINHDIVTECPPLTGATKRVHTNACLLLLMKVSGWSIDECRYLTSVFEQTRNDAIDRFANDVRTRTLVINNGGRVTAPHPSSDLRRSTRAHVDMRDAQFIVTKGDATSMGRRVTTAIDMVIDARRMPTEFAAPVYPHGPVLNAIVIEHRPYEEGPPLECHVVDDRPTG